MTYHHHRNRLFDPNSPRVSCVYHTLRRNKRTVIRITITMRRNISTHPSSTTYNQQTIANSPISIMHTNSFLALQHPRLMRHHTRFMQRRLSVQNQRITVPQMPMDLLVDRCSPRRQAEAGSTVGVTLWRQELIRDGRSLLNRQFILHIIR